MDGLECNEINVSAIEKNLFRIEAEFFNKEYRRVEALLKKYDKLKVYAKKIECGPFGSNLLDTDYVDKGVLVVRPFNLINATIEDERLVYISEETIKRNGLKKYSKKIVLFSRVGDIKAGYANREDFTISPNIIAVELNKEELAKYFAVFFNTYYGITQIQRQLKVAAQPTISTNIISELRVPMFNSMMSGIVHCVNLAEAYQSKANSLYIDAEKHLISKLGLKDFSGTKENVAVKNLSRSFGETGRLDAEYYQPKYDELLAMLGKVKTAKLGDIVNITKSIEPGSEYYVEKGIPFVRVSDVNRFEISEPQIRISESVVPGIERLYPKENTILFSKDGSVGIAYKLEENAKFVTSSALLHLTVSKPQNVLPDYLTLVLNSSVVRLQGERDSNGAVIQHWKPSEIKKVIIPLLDMDIQKEISKEIQSSFILRHQSKQLLDCAVQAVEMAIEHNEEKATAWLDEKVKEIESI